MVVKAPPVRCGSSVARGPRCFDELVGGVLSAWWGEIDVKVIWELKVRVRLLGAGSAWVEFCRPPVLPLLLWGPSGASDESTAKRPISTVNGLGGEEPGPEQGLTPVNCTVGGRGNGPVGTGLESVISICVPSRSGVGA